ncbi:glycosyltransferase [Nocardioidaceae bacterium]|nr:glycosyltransferase [Nocardioidaceae bacterium]
MLSEGDAHRVVAVVVTWNRRELLGEALDALAAQEHPLERVVVIDNASDDGTAELLAHRAQSDPLLDVRTLAENLGGAGGFAAGIARALTHSPDLVWLLDDDTVPTATALGAAVTAWRDHPGDPQGRRPAVVASRVVWTDGRDHPMNTPREKPGVSRGERAAAAAVGCTAVRSASFVSILCDAARVRERGLPVADYFLWNDDFEYSTRLIRGGSGLWCPASVVVHKTRTFGATDVDPGERFFWEVRNKTWMFTRSTSLAPSEKLLYGASTVRRWARTYARSADRATLRRGLVRGLREGFTTQPAPTGRLVAHARESRGIGRDLDAGVAFSLLMSTWAGDRPDFLREAFRSAVVDQTRRPAEVVLVEDGPVTPELEEALTELVAQSPVPVRRLRLPANGGLGPALDAGLAACRHDVVARMDTDDLCVPDRFERQLPLIEAGADIVGAGLVEFGETPEDVVGRRTPPTDPAEIRRVIRFRDPFNHPTVVYRRAAVLAAGGYTDMPLMEDYLLFTRMVEAGAEPANLAEPLVLYRVGAGAYARRGGGALLRSELALQRRFRRLGLTSRRQYARNVLVRGGYRLVPESVRRAAYRRLLANRGDGPGSQPSARGDRTPIDSSRP